MGLQLSVLDRAHKQTGDSDQAALKRTIAHAREVEELGFRRFFVAEHHGVPGIPGSQPALLAQAVAHATSSIRVGTAGIMLTNHPPLVVAEQIGLLTSLYPGRVDVGTGNSVGFTRPVRAALRQGEPAEAKARYDDDLAELRAHLLGDAAVTSRPRPTGELSIFVLAGFRSIALAARHGMGVIVAGPSLLDDTAHPHHPGLAHYRSEFRDRGLGSQPRAMIALDIAVAETEDAARDLLLPQHVAGVLSRRTGEFGALPTLDEIRRMDLSEREKRRVKDSLATAVYGTPHQVGKRLREIAAYAGVDEIVVTGAMSDTEGRRRSEQLLAEVCS
ncbi:MsnO8 family LLM class oxidoreductase [Corynebacterium yudongzhengii]|uniref:MsnO8 family LLM class oxidoreductase n=1 Tax=Corynebacterium yudongzhengii TaxID=2080740 RepID=UPI001F2FEEB7|nr:MsnO8 family LLM class oxidoreductase [Corynebacterium yudongzhengii]